MSELLPLVHALETALRAERYIEVAQRAAELRMRVSSLGPTQDSSPSEALRQELDRRDLLLERTLALTLAEGLRPVADEVLNGMLTVLQAQRGLVGLGTGSDWTVLAARELSGEDFEDPRSQVSSTIIERVLATGESVVTRDAHSEVHARSVHRLMLRSVACFPLSHQGRLLGFVYLDHPEAEGLFDAAALSSLRAWLPIVAASVDRASSAAPAVGLPGVVTRSPRLGAVLDELARIARFEAPILLTGETGTGKSLVAQQLHTVSARAQGPFLHVNCGAIPEALLEGELFGAEPGAYTGARVRRIGKFEAASGGTLFLDELDALPLSCQVKLLVALQEGKITRLGGNEVIPVDVRIIAAMNSDPLARIASGQLREDLYYRLAVFVAELPPLRERPEDIPLLVRHILKRTAERYELPPLRISPQAEERLMAHRWPGNVRELENALDRSALLSKEGLIDTLKLVPSPRPQEVSEPAPRDALAALHFAAKALVDAMVVHSELRDLKVSKAFEGALLLAMEQRLGSRERCFAFLGRAHELQSRNHNRTWSRALNRLKALGETLGLPIAKGAL